MSSNRSIAELSLSFTGIYEAELLTELMLREWKHPLASDEEFRNHLLESAAEVLTASVAGERLTDEIAPGNINLVVALWIAESMMLDGADAMPSAERSAREAWLGSVRRSVPSCFCNPELLP